MPSCCHLQVVGAVGWANAQLALTDDMNPALKEIIRSCFKEPQNRPSFGQIISTLKPMVQNTPIPPPPPMASPELVNIQRPRPMASPMLVSPMLASPMLAAPSRSSSNLSSQQGSSQQVPSQHMSSQQASSQQITPMEDRRLSSQHLSGRASPSSGQNQDPADAAGDKFAEVVRRVMHIASSAKSQVGQHVNEGAVAHHNASNATPSASQSPQQQ